MLAKALNEIIEVTLLPFDSLLVMYDDFHKSNSVSCSGLTTSSGTAR
jgi:hypothetical protein